MQRGDGVFGAFIVRQPPSRELHHGNYDLDLPEHNIIVNDWWERETAPSFAYHHHGIGDNKPASMLINGKAYVSKEIHQAVSMIGKGQGSHKYKK